MQFKNMFFLITVGLGLGLASPAFGMSFSKLPSWHAMRCVAASGISSLAQKLNCASQQVQTSAASGIISLQNNIKKIGSYYPVIATAVGIGLVAKAASHVWNKISHVRQINNQIWLDQNGNNIIDATTRMLNTMYTNRLRLNLSENTELDFGTVLAFWRYDLLPKDHDVHDTDHAKIWN